MHLVERYHMRAELDKRHKNKHMIVIKGVAENQHYTLGSCILRLQLKIMRRSYHTLIQSTGNSMPRLGKTSWSVPRCWPRGFPSLNRSTQHWRDFNQDSHQKLHSQMCTFWRVLSLGPWGRRSRFYVCGGSAANTMSARYQWYKISRKLAEWDSNLHPQCCVILSKLDKTSIPVPRYWTWGFI